MSALNKKSFLTWLKEGGIYVVLLVLLAIIIFQDPTFLSLLNLSNILTQSSPEMATMPIALVILIVCAIGAVIGLVNGIIIAYLNVTPFITTLGTMIIVYGINSLYYDFVGNPEAAKVSGVNVALNLLMIYALSGVFYAFGGLLEAGRIGSATNNLGFMYELDAIAACVVGGVSFSGGVGTVFGVVTGVIIFTVINYGLTYIGVNPYWQYIIKGGIIIFAVALDSLKYARKK